MQTPGSSRADRATRSRARSLVAIPLLTLVLATFLAYEAWDAARRHSEVAERTIRDYASFAAWEFSATAKDVLYSNIMWVLASVADLEVTAPGQWLPPASALAHDAHRKFLCREDTSRYYFRLDIRTGELTTDRARLSPAMAAWLRDTVTTHARTEYGLDWRYAAIFGTVGAQPRAIVYHLVRDTDRRPAAAYGFELCLDEFGWLSYQKVMAHYAILPPALTHGAPNDSVPNDSLLSVHVTDAGGHTIFKSRVQYASPYIGSHRLDTFGGITTTVALRPELAKSLIIGGLPRSRLPLLLGVFALTVVLSVVSIQQLRREQELARMRSDFIASVSHELRTPLAQMRMFAETLLLGRVRNEEEHDRSLQIIDQEARRLTHLVENILQFSRAERRALRLAPVLGDVTAQVDEAIEMFAPVARARRVTVEAFLEEDVVAVVDAGALRQIVLNLLDNAVKYGPPGQTVTVRLSSARDSLRLCVEDQGPGIPATERERIWAPFHRLDDAANSSVAGSGIGLAVVAELVALHGGRTWVEDAPVRGARFVVELPGAGTRDPGLGTRHAEPESRIPTPDTVAAAGPESV